MPLRTTVAQLFAVRLLRLGRYASKGELIVKSAAAAEAVEKTLRGKVKKPTFPPRLEIPQTTRDSHFPTASTATAL